MGTPEAHRAAKKRQQDEAEEEQDLEYGASLAEGAPPLSVTRERALDTGLSIEGTPLGVGRMSACRWTSG